jgi:hypothetical protein
VSKNRLFDIAENTLRDESENNEIAVTLSDLSLNYDSLDIFEELDVQYTQELETLFN